MDRSKLHLLLSQQEITEGVRKLGNQIRSDYDGLSLLLLESLSMPLEGGVSDIVFKLLED